MSTFVENQNPEYALYYGLEKEEIKNNETKIVVNSLTKSGKTDLFSLVLIKSNMNKELKVDVAVKPSEFTTTLNKGKRYAKEFFSGITPSVNYILISGSSLESERYHYTIESGIHTNLTVAQFNLDWPGDPDLPAGEYVSDITIDYSIQ